MAVAGANSARAETVRLQEELEENDLEKLEGLLEVAHLMKVEEALKALQAQVLGLEASVVGDCREWRLMNLKLYIT